MTRDSFSGKTHGGSGIVPEVLNEDNYEPWKRCLKNYLVGHGLWGVVSGKESEPDKLCKEEHDEWKRKNALALHAIQMSCGTGIYAKFNKAHISAHYAWTHLAEKASGLKPPPSMDHEEEFHVEDDGVRDYLDYDILYRASEEGNWKAIQAFLQEHPNAIRARVSSHKDTALHIAILSGHIDIAHKLVAKMDESDLEMVNEYGATSLSLAAICGAQKLAAAMLQKNKNLVKIANEHDDGQLPVIVAALYGQKSMVHYLYKMTPKSEFSPTNGGNGAMLLNCLITAEIYDVALMLLGRYPELGVTPDHHGHYALQILAHKPSAFRSGMKLAFWEKWIYYFVRVHPPLDSQRGSWGVKLGESQYFSSNADHRTIHVSVEEEVESELGGMGSSRALKLFREFGWHILQCLVPEITYIHQRKLVHEEAIKLLCFMFQGLRKLSNQQLEKMDIDTVIYDAVKHGIIEIILEMIKHKPDIIWKKDKKGRTIFAHAIVLRQEKIFSLIYGLGTRKSIMARRHDIFRNNYLHLAAKLSPPSQLKRVSGAALQMQRELQWFKEVESIAQPKLKEEVNENNKTPALLFTKEHKDLMEDAETWMKNTAGSSMIVGTLVAAVMFTTAFTVPGGNRDDTGLPTMLGTQPVVFLIFMISNGLSMFSSSMSVLMFLGILTARYAEEDFLKSLPTKLIFGLTCLFLSIVTMMTSFGASLYLILRDKLSWISIPIIILSVIPVALFSMLHFPLLIEITIRTYGFGIFHKPKKELK